jgi:hypothetical protein
MTSTLLISILLSIVGTIGLLMVKQLIKIADTLKEVDKKLGILSNDHSNLKEDHIELKQRVSKLEAV